MKHATYGKDNGRIDPIVKTVNWKSTIAGEGMSAPERRRYAEKLQEQVAADVMNGWNFKGPRPLTPSTNDLSSAQWLYGTR